MKTTEIKEITPIFFSKFDGGQPTACSGFLSAIQPSFVVVKYVDEDGVKHNVRFRRAPGSKAGWGIGVSKFWRLSDVERKKYCHTDVSAKRSR